jgi:hypothetical protein
VAQAQLELSSRRRDWKLNLGSRSGDACASSRNRVFFILDASQASLVFFSGVVFSFKKELTTAVISLVSRVLRSFLCKTKIAEEMSVQQLVVLAWFQVYFVRFFVKQKLLKKCLFSNLSFLAWFHVYVCSLLILANCSRRYIC